MTFKPYERISIFYWFAALKDTFSRKFPDFFQPINATTGGRKMGCGQFLRGTDRIQPPRSIRRFYLLPRKRSRRLRGSGQRGADSNRLRLRQRYCRRLYQIEQHAAHPPRQNGVFRYAPRRRGYGGSRRVNGDNARVVPAIHVALAPRKDQTGAELHLP